MKKHLKWLVLPALLLLGLFYREFYVPPSSAKEPVAFEVKANESFGEIAAKLDSQNLIRNKTLFAWYGRLLGYDTDIKAGRYRLDPNLSPTAILKFLVNPEHSEISVTIPEGYSIFDIDKKLTSLKLIKEGEFIVFAKSASSTAGSIEGYLFPDTYFIFSDVFQPEELAQLMQKNFEKKVTQGLADDIKKNKRSLHEIITMASILEKEVRTKEDYSTVSGILWKRLDNDWPLQVDATLLYEKEGRNISVDNLREDSPYSTYTRLGLPKTPISNPGLEMIKAALRPVDSEYWFYLTASDGKVIYAKTNEEHNKNKRHL